LQRQVADCGAVIQSLQDAKDDALVAKRKEKEKEKSEVEVTLLEIKAMVCRRKCSLCGLFCVFEVRRVCTPVGWLHRLFDFIP
jgi:hypothetical protein